MTQEDPYKLRAEAQHVGFFETPVAYCKLKNGEQVIQELEASIRKQMAATEGVQRSNFGGWHSDTDMMDWGGKAAESLSETAISICKRLTHFEEASPDSYEWVCRMWANVNPKGGMNHIHAHPGNLWAAVLYIDMGDDRDGAGKDVGVPSILKTRDFPWRPCITRRCG